MIALTNATTMFVIGLYAPEINCRIGFDNRYPTPIKNVPIKILDKLLETKKVEKGAHLVKI